MRKINWGVLGTGNIISKGGVAIQRASNSQWRGIAGRNPDNSARAAKKYGLDQVYDSYEHLLADPEIDAVYIALLNHLHYEWTMKAIEAGKHVLLEKPLTMNAQEGKRIQAAAEKHEIQIMEAHMWHFQPAYPWTKEKIDAGVIGEIGLIRSSFGFNLVEGSTRWVREWGGGSLYDIGCYPVAWSRYFMGAEPEAVEGSLIMHKKHRVDRRFHGTLYFPGDRIAQVSSAFDLAGGMSLEIIGNGGTIELKNSVTAEVLENTVHVHSQEHGHEQKTWTSDRIEPYQRQVEGFAAALLEGKPVPRGCADGVAHMEILDALFESDRLGHKVNLR